MKEQLIQKLNQLHQEALDEMNRQNTEQGLFDVKVRYLGKKGVLTDVLKNLSHLTQDERPEVGQLANQMKGKLENTYALRLTELKNFSILQKLQSEKLDVTLPGKPWPKGHLHPVYQVLKDIKKIFKSMGFDIYEGPEIENDYYNFEALNIPQHHPARDMHDTFFVGKNYLLRTHTSPVQIRVMENKKPPIWMVAPGVVYRKDSDMTHTPMFHQFECLAVDIGINLAHLKGVIETFLKEIFQDAKIKVRFRPSFFPFTEPSFEVDMLFSGSWLEIMGCGMVDPNVFKFVNIDSEKYTGFAFGAGIERIAMLKYGIKDIRTFFENDLKFLSQF